MRSVVLTVTISKDTYVVVGRPAVINVKAAATLSHEQLQLCFTFVAKSTGGS
jgi:hypothetical protein